MLLALEAWWVAQKGAYAFKQSMGSQENRSHAYKLFEKSCSRADPRLQLFESTMLASVALQNAKRVQLAMVPPRNSCDTHITEMPLKRVLPTEVTM